MKTPKYLNLFEMTPKTQTIVNTAISLFTDYIYNSFKFGGPDWKV